MRADNIQTAAGVTATALSLRYTDAASIDSEIYNFEADQLA